MIVLIKMADYELILGAYIRFAFAFSSTFVTSPSYIAIFSFAIKTINKAFWISDQMISMGALGWNNSERFITICNIQIIQAFKVFSFFQSSSFQPFILFSDIFWVMIMLVLLKNNIISPGSNRSFTESIATTTPPVEIPIFYWSGIWKSVAILILNCIARTPFRAKYPWKRLKGMKMLLEWICNRLKYLLKRQFFSLFRTLV